MISNASANKDKYPGSILYEHRRYLRVCMSPFLQKLQNQSSALFSNVCSSLYASALSIYPDIYAVVTFNKQNDSYRLVT